MVLDKNGSPGEIRSCAGYTAYGKGGKKAESNGRGDRRVQKAAEKIEMVQRILPAMGRYGTWQGYLLRVLRDDTMRAYGVHAIHRAALSAHLEKQGTPIGSLDMLIAAHALSIEPGFCNIWVESSSVYNNEKEFNRIPRLKIENWVR